jgi:hypothetical protein
MLRSLEFEHMPRFRTALLLGVGVLVTTWVSAPAAPTAPPAPVSVEDMARIEAMAPLAEALDQEVGRLRAQLAAVPKAPEPRRDPFSFGDRRPAPREAQPVILSETPVEDAVELPPAVLWPTLAAVMVESTGTTAVVAWGDTIEFLKADGSFKDFRVVAISGNTLDLRHEPTGTLRTLSLR